MVFNRDECEHIRITNKRNVIQTLYNIHGWILKENSKAKYLEVTCHLNSYIDVMTKRASQFTTFLRKTFQAAQKMLRPNATSQYSILQLDYASTVWDYVTKANITKLESLYCM